MIINTKTSSSISEPLVFPNEYSIMVLLVDDQAIVAQSVRRAIAGRPDINLHYCSDPADAIKVANEVNPTVILQDWVMPSIDGVDLLQLFRSNPATAETPIIVLSSEENAEVKSQAFSAGANDYLVKLPDRAELIARIQYHSKAHLNRIQRDEGLRRLKDSQQHLAESNEALISINQRLQEASEQLNAALLAAEQRTREAFKLSELVEVLQSCQTLKEAYQVAQRVLPTILSSNSGGLCITRASRDLVEVVASWGDPNLSEKAFVPDDCWALRRGKAHVVKDSLSPVICTHVKTPPAHGYICIPMAAQGETLGVLHLECSTTSTLVSCTESAEVIPNHYSQALAVAERISWALANLSMRDILRVQSIRDPLTGLYNRRYMEESLERELRRAARSHQSLSILMLDVDHFKNFNDTYGHQAGDTLLRALSDFLVQRTRGHDIVCRFGGEEFVLILTDASLEAALQRAELLREELKQLTVHHARKVLGRITLSIGIACFPVHGQTIKELLHSADQGLYRAKHNGRDGVAVITANDFAETQKTHS